MINEFSNRTLVEHVECCASDRDVIRAELKGLITQPFRARLYHRVINDRIEELKSYGYNTAAEGLQNFYDGYVRMRTRNGKKLYI